MPPALHTNRTHTCLYAALAQRLHATPLLTAWTPRRDRTRIRLQSRGGQSQHSFQQRRRHCTPRRQHAVLVLSQAVIAMCPNMLHQGTAHVGERL